MSGFGGGGFGGGGFGGGSHHQQPNTNNASFGVAPAAPFGAAPAAPFGASPAAPFGGANNNNNMAPFGSQPMGGQPQQQSFGSPPAAPFGNSGFGTAAPATSTGFGASPQPPANVGFGGASNSTTNNPFMTGPTTTTNQSQPSAPSFGGTTTTFGASQNVVTTGSTFGSSAPQNNNATTFGSAPQSGQGFGGGGGGSGFGSSQGGGGFGSSQGGGFGGGGGFGSSQNTMLMNNNDSNPFGTSTQQQQQPQAVSFGMSSNVMPSSLSHPKHPPETNKTWQRSAGTASNNNPFGTTTSSSSSQMNHGNNDEHTMNDGSMMSPFDQQQQQQNDNSMGFQTQQQQQQQVDDGGDQARLKAKIQEKKRLLEEKKKKLLERQKQRKNQGGKDSPPPPSSPPRSASPPRPSSSSSSNNNQASLAERNAVRFKEQTQEQSLLPPDVVAKATISQNVDRQAEKNREDLHRAVSLIGTCEYMCPDDELIRRDRESDIQLLEIPQPGTLHPPDWTLRNTAVKRFRRSAADYKLDVPEWVRPPDVLEQVCGYLEEWVMERDRQGPDPRFPNNQTPPPLDVYQFIWDRTRMIRKDLTLQNYVGTGGKCDARAVRCHERIARWHAMCEHQLSHIFEFTNAQSQQNIQELGQTMKTLNQFYDDSMNRSTVEVPDENGRETRTNLTQFSQGCVSDAVQGKDPVDFDGKPLNNTSDNDALLQQRLIGKHAAGSPGNGTAEPEMRGLYMLLTMNNEGGLEVLKYASSLFEKRPEIFHSKPVQLALDVFKAKKEYNYARFFAILRSRSTPYLFSCLMFKYVELMRKVAFRIMSKTFGARKKDTGDTIYDSYPLVRLAELLCFESMAEAREACEHYNITVKQEKVSDDNVQEVIYWRQTDFREPKHPEKGHIIPLKPWKMTRIIERKLNGATRLAVCRGEVSGEGAALAGSHQSIRTIEQPQPQFSGMTPEERAKAAALAMEQKQKEAKEARDKIDREREELAMKLKMAEDKRKRELEELRRDQLEQEKQERALREEQERKRKIAEEEALRVEEEKKRKAQEEFERQEAEKRRLQLIEEKARKERERVERKKMIAEEKRRQEEERRIAEEERKRKIEEERKAAIAKAKLLEKLRREQEIKRQQEIEERRKAKEWQDRVDLARKKLLWLRWRRQCSRQMEQTYASEASLNDIDPTFRDDSFNIGQSLQKANSQERFYAESKWAVSEVGDSRTILEDLLQTQSTQLSLSEMALEEIESSVILRQSSTDLQAMESAKKTTLLCKVAVVLPSCTDLATESMVDLIRSWLNKCLNFGSVESAQRRTSGKMSYEIRSVVRFGSSKGHCSDCDMALVVVPPPWSTLPDMEAGIELLHPLIEDHIPRVLLVLCENFQPSYFETMNNLLASRFCGNMKNLQIIYNRKPSLDAYETAIESACRKLANIFVREVCVNIVRVPTIQIASMVITGSMWTTSSNGTVYESDIVKCASSALLALNDELRFQLDNNRDAWSNWPPPDFASGSEIKSYFSEHESLPKKWPESIRQFSACKSMSRLLSSFSFSYTEIMKVLLDGASRYVIDECSTLYAKRQFRRCLEKALMLTSDSELTKVPDYLFLPNGLLEQIVERSIARVASDDTTCRPSVLLDFAPSTTDNLLLTDGQISTSREIVNVQSPRPLGTSNATLENISNVKKAADEQPNNPSSKRSRIMSIGDENAGAKKWDDINSPHQCKKRRESGAFSTEVQASAAFTKRLEELVHGKPVELFVGDLYLPRILGNSIKLNPSV